MSCAAPLIVPRRDRPLYGRVYISRTMGIDFVMTVIDLDQWRTASLLIKRHGRDAAIVAAQRAGDLGGQASWQQIVDAIPRSQRTR